MGKPPPVLRGGFRYTEGTPKQFTRTDIERPRTRDFCPDCGTHILTRRPGLPAVILKVGTLDQPALFGAPQMAIYTIDKQPFHLIAEAAIRADLIAAKAGIMKLAAAHGVGVGTVQRIKAAMAG